MPIVEYNGYLMVFEHHKREIVGFTIYKGHMEGNSTSSDDVPEDILAELHRRAEAKIK